MKRRTTKNLRTYRIERRKKDWWKYLWSYDDKFLYLEPEE